MEKTMTVAELEALARNNGGTIYWERGRKPAPETMVEVREDGEVYSMPDREGWMDLVARCV